MNWNTPGYVEPRGYCESTPPRGIEPTDTPPEDFNVSSTSDRIW
eukprot:CAMPEP_0197550686 /NCGR_PEP_ID=MMETSP1320-20131121/4191_1 /TAXON_ID=91990 /ORGANISM="Bolidomonas sp., Strain RCC2347" /LENGTH=43 /DNA_ID= /DNA_START= /DNA_END= /DNA_ORIENTATION=